jgi:hypothetical protein
MPPENDERRDYSVLIAVIEERLKNFKDEFDKTVDRLEKKVDQNNLICNEVTKNTNDISKLKGALGVLGTIGTILFGGIITWIAGLWGNK